MIQFSRVTIYPVGPNEYVELIAASSGYTEGLELRDQTYRDAAVSDRWVHTYRFPSFEVKAGDVIRVYSGFGTDKMDRQFGGGRLFTLHWRLATCVWNDDADLAEVGYFALAGSSARKPSAVAALRGIGGFLDAKTLPSNMQPVASQGIIGGFLGTNLNPPGGQAIATKGIIGLLGR